MKSNPSALKRKLGENSLIEVIDMGSLDFSKDLTYFSSRVNKLFSKRKDIADYLVKGAKKIVDNAIFQYEDLCELDIGEIDAIMDYHIVDDVYGVYSPKRYKRRKSLLMRKNRRIEFVKSGKNYYYVIELDAPFNKSIVFNSDGELSPALPSGLPKMLDEEGIPPLPWIQSEQVWTEPRPFWDETINEVKAMLNII